MELWPLVVPILVVCAAAVSVVRGARREPDVIDVHDDTVAIEPVSLFEGGVATERPPASAPGPLLAPPGSLGGRLRARADVGPRPAEPRVPTRPIRIRRRPLVAPGRER